MARTVCTSRRCLFVTGKVWPASLPLLLDGGDRSTGTTCRATLALVRGGLVLNPVPLVVRFPSPKYEWRREAEVQVIFPFTVSLVGESSKLCWDTPVFSGSVEEETLRELAENELKRKVRLRMPSQVKWLS
ncbi:hypothetical protein FNV43_RR21788 [Rhamnella rubrinervis]|uniref:Uncharacterized protein n=1 Tax=Rhamnella rubrinervis TaxID=2594499 RepID=A0A8K0DUX7_9ROSA|nr:hypothetical protein FNV43_RR21788 [Rhamnella rubrinervis]